MESYWPSVVIHPTGKKSTAEIVGLSNLDVIDEYQLSVQPIVLGSGLPLLKIVKKRIDLRLIRTKTFGCGVVTLYYERTNKLAHR